MLVYANHLSFEGLDAEQAVLKGVGGWLKEQLGFGLHPEVLRRDGEHRGTKGSVRTHLRIYSSYEGEPALCAWVLRHADEAYGRQWIAEVGVKKTGSTIEASCVVKTDEASTLVSAPVAASQPRVIRYIIRNILSADDASFTGQVPGEAVKAIGEDRDSYRAFRAEVERPDRIGALVLVSATRDGEYLVDPGHLQQTLVGLAQVVQVVPESDSFEMAEVLSKQWSAWGGAINVLSLPNFSGSVRYRYFLPDDIRDWGNPNHRISQLLAWVTSSTNLPRLRQHVRPEGVVQLATRRRMHDVRERSANMDIAQLRHELHEVSRQAEENEAFFNELVEVNARLEDRVARLTDEQKDTEDNLRKKDYLTQTLKDQLARSGGGIVTPDIDALLMLITRKDDPTPLECLSIIEQFYGDRCTVLENARSSAKRMNGFLYGRDLLGLLVRLVCGYRDALLDGGDSNARKVFGKSEYAAKESETVMSNKSMLRHRTFDYDGEPVEMLRHLKIGVSDDVSKTIRVHFHWDGARKKIVIGHCGEHLPVSSH